MEERVKFGPIGFESHTGRGAEDPEDAAYARGVEDTRAALIAFLRSQVGATNLGLLATHVETGEVLSMASVLEHAAKVRA